MLSLTVKNNCFFFLKEGRSCLFPSSLMEGGQIIEQMNVSLGLGSVLPTELFLWFQFVRQNLKLRSCTQDPTLQAACCLKVLPLPLQCIKHKLQYFSSFVFAWYYTLGDSAGCWLLACILPEYVSLAQVALTVQRGRFLSKKKVFRTYMKQLHLKVLQKRQRHPVTYGKIHQIPLELPDTLTTDSSAL